ncbi:MAG: hypothetical protein ACI8Y7_000604 [Candidatus Woesearchaeota archaeon]|jgi:hypothetical protein
MAKKDEKTTNEPSKDEQIGFHKGSISVLSKEREELLKIVNITEQLIQMHSKGLEDLGVNVADLMPKEEVRPLPRKSVPIENLI